MSHSPRQKYTPSQWQQFIDAQSASGQTQAVFCAAQGLSKSSFQHWKRRLTASESATPPAALFTPLTDEATPAVDGGWTIELDLGAGLRLRLSRT